MPRAATGRIRPGDTIEPFVLDTVSKERLSIPNDSVLTHLQFRRFAGCPVCTLHLREFIRRHEELRARGICEVVVFNSSREALLEYHADVPFALIADPRRALYRRFGLERTLGSLLHPATWPAVIEGVLLARIALPEEKLTAFGLPADFLIAPDGVVVACKYGRHADDQWSVDEVISEAKDSMKHQQRGVEK